jgi:hypothetical protein
MQSVVPVFIASPNDVCEEREFAVEAVRSVSSKIATIYGKCPIVYRRSRVPVVSVESLSTVGISDGCSIPRRAA